MKIFVCKTSELPENAQTTIRVGRQSVLVLNHQGKYYALRNVCTHEAVPLAGGQVQNGQIECAKHGATFDLASGKATKMPAVKAVRLYQAIVENDEVFVEEL